MSGERTVPPRLTGSDHLAMANALQIIDVPTEAAVMRVLDHRHDIDAEAQRLAQAARLTAARHAARRRARLATLRGWAILFAVCAVPLAGAMAYPESVIRAAPAAAHLYSLAGVEVNVAGFMIRDATSELQIVSGTSLLAVSGEIVNTGKWPRKPPSLRFSLRDARGEQTHAWSLDGVGSGKLEPGEATSFVTRVPAPPVPVGEVEIRFARGE
jgi:hypothetical protein